MSDTDPNAIRARAQAATKGPWAWYGDMSNNEGTLESNESAPAVISASGMHTEGYIFIEPGDAEFIAHAREDVPALLALVESLTAELATAKADAWSAGFRAGRGADHNPCWWPANPYRAQPVAEKGADHD